eukprot:364980-Chlamydomonas_euryale.AAC.12
MQLRSQDAPEAFRRVPFAWRPRKDWPACLRAASMSRSAHTPELMSVAGAADVRTSCRETQSGMKLREHGRQHPCSPIGPLASSHPIADIDWVWHCSLSCLVWRLSGLELLGLRCLCRTSG